MSIQGFEGAASKPLLKKNIIEYHDKYNEVYETINPNKPFPSNVDEIQETILCLDNAIVRLNDLQKLVGKVIDHSRLENGFFSRTALSYLHDFKIPTLIEKCNHLILRIGAVFNDKGCKFAYSKITSSGSKDEEGFSHFSSPSIDLSKLPSWQPPRTGKIRNALRNATWCCLNEKKDKVKYYWEEIPKGPHTYPYPTSEALASAIVRELMPKSKSIELKDFPLETHPKSSFINPFPVAEIKDTSETPTVITRLIVKYNTGWGISLGIQGSGHGMNNWGELKKLRNIDADTWEFEIKGNFTGSFEYKIVQILEDGSTRWEKGSNRRIDYGDKKAFTPEF